MAVVIPTGSAFVVPSSRLVDCSPAVSFRLAASTRREQEIAQLEQEIQEALQQREELRLELEEEIRAFQQQFESEKKLLENADVGISKKIEKLQRVQAGGGGLLDGVDMEELSSLLKTGGIPLAALSTVAVAGAVVQRRQKQLAAQEAARLEEERRKERFEQMVAEETAKQQFKKKAIKVRI